MKLVQAATAGYRSMPKSAQKKRQKLSFRELALRKKLAKEWEQLSEEERMALRVQRAKAGIKCNICGAVGYYRCAIRYPIFYTLVIASWDRD